MGAMGRADDDWAIIYHHLCLCEQLYIHLPSATDYDVTHVTLRETCSSTAVDIIPDSRELIIPTCLGPLFIMQSTIILLATKRYSSRLLSSSFSIDYIGGVEVLTVPNSLYHMTRRICIVLNQFSLSSKLLDSLVECIVFVIRAMTHNPHLNVVPV